MKKVISSERLPIKLWLDDIEDGALEQAKNLANLPFAFKHIAILPDSHQGYGMPIGGILVTKDIIIPNAVGVDIGCGMVALKTELTRIETPKLKSILSEIRKTVPVGFNKHSNEQDVKLMPGFLNYEHYDDWLRDKPICYRQFSNALLSLGSLGGGNHFLEIQQDTDGFIWIMIHSGSRNLGKKVADYYNNIAKDLNGKWFGSIPANYDLAYLPVDSQIGQDYIKEMNYCVGFAYANRKLMMDRVVEIFYDQIPDFEISVPTRGNYELGEINIAHNYASLENHFGQNVWVHRKGATLARKDTIGIIPGSQGSKSYIVRGKGNKESFESCSHGAGRLMSRTKAKNELNLEEEVKRLNDKGIIHSIRGKSSLDEAPSAYKDIDIVMENQKDLVDILVQLSPLAVIKG